jgi:hypothetical protein
MSGICIGGGMYAIYTLTTGAKNGLDLTGHKSLPEAITALARWSLTWVETDKVDAVSKVLRDAVERAIADRKRDDEEDRAIVAKRQRREAKEPPG